MRRSVRVPAVWDESRSSANVIQTCAGYLLRWLVVRRRLNKIAAGTSSPLIVAQAGAPIRARVAVQAHPLAVSKKVAIAMLSNDQGRVRVLMLTPLARVHALNLKSSSSCGRST